jgi:hypothetical protein
VCTKPRCGLNTSHSLPTLACVHSHLDSLMTLGLTQDSFTRTRSLPSPPSLLVYLHLHLLTRTWTRTQTRTWTCSSLSLSAPCSPPCSLSPCSPPHSRLAPSLAVSNIVLDTVPHAIMAGWQKLGMESMYMSDEGGPGRGAILSVSMMMGLGSPGGGRTLCQLQTQWCDRGRKCRLQH